jgi:hypothetical protein
MCPIKFQSLLVFLGPLLAYPKAKFKTVVIKDLPVLDH